MANPGSRGLSLVSPSLPLPLEIEILIYPRWQNLADAARRLLLWRP
jgi:hypothetical protein